MRLRATGEPPALHTTLEALTFRGAHDINRFTLSKEADIKFRAKFDAIEVRAFLQPDLAQYLERAKFGTRAALAVLRDLQQLLDLFIFLRAVFLRPRRSSRLLHPRTSCRAAPAGSPAGVCAAPSAGAGYAQDVPVPGASLVLPASVRSRFEWLHIRHGQRS